MPLTPDASTRNYFRIPWKKGKAVAAVYPEPFDPDFHPYLDVTRLFWKAAFRCRRSMRSTAERESSSGGSRRPAVVSGLRSASPEECEEYKEQAINLIARIQKATEKAHEMQSIASRLAFDEAKAFLGTRFLRRAYFRSLRGETLRHAEAAELKAELNDIAAELAAAPRVLCHRDFHAANLMLDSKNQLRVVDHQDARMGPASYDLVSFLLDRQPTPPSLAELRAHRLHLLEERRLLGLERA